MGGKSSLRGRCVQPCRRVYQQKHRKGRFFSCQDLSLDVLTKSLLTMPKVVSWKIEGRKKGPHYVYYATAAYKLLRDHPNDPKAKKQADEILNMALGRPRTHATFLPQNPYSPTVPGEQTSSGLLVGKVQKEVPVKEKTQGKQKKDYRPPRPKYIFKPRMELNAGDFLRIGYEDEPWHFTYKITKRVPKGGTLSLHVPPRKDPKSGTGVFLIDRREKGLVEQVSKWEAKLKECHGRKPSAVEFEPQFPERAKRPTAVSILLRPGLPQGKPGKVGKFTGNINGLWLSPKPVKTISKTLFPRISWWLPPVIWPNEEAKWKHLIRDVLRKGGRQFILGSPWQISFFEDAKVSCVAGPFCNTSNPAEIAMLSQLGFRGAIVSPELSGEEMLSLPAQSCLPLGVVLSGYWPMGVSRWPVTGVKPGEPLTSPKGEVFWTRKYGQNTWLYPGWPLDISSHREALLDAGYTMFVNLTEEPPNAIPKAKRTSPFNWDLTLM